MKKSSVQPFNASVFMGDEQFGRKYQAKYADLFKEGDRVLDIGCGTGTFLELLRDRGAGGVGVDTYTPAIQACKSKGLTVFQDTAHQFLTKTRLSFDGVMMSHIVEHMPPQQLLDLFALLHRRTSSGARLVILTPNPREIGVITETFWLDITHVRPYPAPLLVEMLKNCGFEIDSIGTDRDTGHRMQSLRHPRALYKYVVGKIRFGAYFGNGDTCVVARKP